MPRFTRTIEIRAPLEKVFAFHADPVNLVRVAPPGSKTELVSSSDPLLKLGTRVVVRSVQAGIPVRIEAEVIALDSPRFLQDRQIHGPFAHWTHSHRFESIPGGTRLIDEIDYALPMGALGGLVMGKVVSRELQETFAYRQEQTRKLLEEG